jgi:predicted HAD superfamily Cof-like phosphohydrolase
MTHVPQQMVEDWHRAMGAPVGTTPAIRRPELRAELIWEEADETYTAIYGGDLVAAIDGLCDLLYVVYGTAVEFGVDLAPFFAEVHAANLRKAGGPVREDGKIGKPPGWTPPDIAGLLARVSA